MARLRFFCLVRVGLAGGAMLLLASQTATAAGPDRPADRAQVLKSLIDCRKVTDDAARLACYDKAAAEIDKAEAGGDIVVVDRQQARAARRQAFGFNLPTLSIFDKAATKEELNAIDGKVASSTHDANGYWVITLEDGSVWHELGDQEPNLDPRPGKAAHLSRGSLGSFFIKIDGLTTRVKREQ